MYLTECILEILEQSRERLTSAQILDELITYDKFPTADTVMVTMCHMKTKQNYVYQEQRAKCPGCGLKRIMWRITEDGLIKISRRK